MTCPIETYQNVDIFIEQDGDQNYYCILDGKIYRSQLIEAIYSAIDTRKTQPVMKAVKGYGVEYTRYDSDQIYFTVLNIPVSHDRDELMQNAEDALRRCNIPFRRVISAV